VGALHDDANEASVCQAAMANRDTKVGDLCKELGVTKQTLYRLVSGHGRTSGRWIEAAETLGAKWRKHGSSGAVRGFRSGSMGCTEGFAPGVQALVKILALSPCCTLSYSPVRLGNILHAAFRLGIIHLFRKVIGILGAFQPMAWIVSKRLHCSFFHKKNAVPPEHSGVRSILTIFRAINRFGRYS
jgi:hypothetical protein